MLRQNKQILKTPATLSSDRLRCLRQRLFCSRTRAFVSSSSKPLASQVADEPIKSFRFRCTQCGKCCTGSKGQVRVNATELQAMADFKQLTIDDFKSRFINHQPSNSNTTEDAAKQFILKQNDTDIQCIFLRNGNKCSIYPVRPTQCRTFPWWPQNIVTRYDWALAARDCEGIQLAPAGDSKDKDAPQFSYKQILPETITYEIHRSGEDATYEEIQFMLQQLAEAEGDAFIDDYQQELLQKHQRKTVFTNDHLTVMDSFFDEVRPSRCFVFNNRPHLVQSEVYIKPQDPSTDDNDSRSVGAPPTIQFDRSRLALEIHRAMSLPLLWLPTTKPLRIAVLGAGASALPMFWLVNTDHQIAKIDVVEPDSMVNQLARDWFGVEHSAHGGTLEIVEKTGEQFIADHLTASCSNESLRYDLIVIDVEDGTNPSAGSRSPTTTLSSVQAPPASMLQQDFLIKLHQSLGANGLLVMNTISSSHAAEEMMTHRLEQVFAQGIRWRLQTNTMLCWFKQCSPLSSFLHSSASLVESITKQIVQDRFQRENAQIPALLQKHPVITTTDPRDALD